MSFKTNLTAACMAMIGTACVLAMPAPSEAKDGCGHSYRFSYSQQRCVLRTDVSPNRRWQRKADRFCGRTHRFSYNQQRCVRRTDIGRRRWRPVVVRPVARPAVQPVLRPIIQVSF